MRFLVNNFLRGCLVLVPAAATIYVIYWVFRAMDDLVNFGPPGAGLIIAVILITSIGALTSNVVGRALLNGVERVLKSVPLVKLLYTSLRDFMSALVGERRSFDQPVVVSLSADAGEGARAFGFMTQDNLDEYDLPGYVAVYFPQSVNFAGQLLLLPRSRVTPLQVENARLMAFIVSGGVTGRVGESLQPAPPS